VSAQEEADLEIRRHLRDLIANFMRSARSAPNCVSICTAETGHTIVPPKIVADDQLAIDSVQVERWDRDVLAAGGGGGCWP